MLNWRKKAKLVSCGYTPNVRSSKKKSRLPWQTNIISTQFCDSTRYICSFSFQVSGNICHCHLEQRKEEMSRAKDGFGRWNGVCVSWCVCVCEYIRRLVHMSVSDYTNNRKWNCGHMDIWFRIHVHLCLCHKRYKKWVFSHPWDAVIACLGLGCQNVSRYSSCHDSHDTGCTSVTKL